MAVVAVVLLFADLRLGVSYTARFGRIPPTPPTQRCARSRPGACSSFRVLHPSVAHGSLYLYYDMQARRERPSGYSTVAPKAAANLALRLEPLSCGEWRPGTERVLGDLGVRYIAVHGGIEPAQSWFAWRELTDRGWGVLARDGRIATFTRGPAAAPPALPEPRQKIVFCPQWNGRSPRYRHAAFWIRGAGDLVVDLVSAGPDRTTITADGTARSVRVVAPKTLRVPLADRKWHLVTVDVRRADVDVRLVRIATTR